MRDVECELDVKNGKNVYEVEFESNGQEYDYDIDANAGEILQSEKKPDDDANKQQESKKTDNKSQEKKEVKKDTKKETKKDTKKDTKTDNTSTTDIGEAKAKAIALKDAGVSESKTTGLRVERDYDDGRYDDDRYDDDDDRWDD